MSENVYLFVPNLIGKTLLLLLLLLLLVA